MNKTARGLRNCNPLNIRHSESVWQGLRAQQTDSAFVQFTSLAWGFRAAFCVMRTYLLRHRLWTVEAIITRWAPPTENDTERYIQLVCAHSRLARNYRFADEKDPRLCDLVAAMARMECGSMPDYRALEAGWRLYLGK